MKTESKDKILRILVVPIGLFLALIPFSIFPGWNLLTVILYWFVITPFLSIVLPRLIIGNKNHLAESSLGLVFFYGFMVFMIYKHYESDLFKTMLVSFIFNLLVIGIVKLKTKHKVQIT